MTDFLKLNIREHWPLHGVSTDSELLSLAKQLGIHIDDVLISNQIEGALDQSRTYLILLKDTQDVGHWVCCDKGYYFDSFGVGPPTKLGLKKYNKIHYQNTYGNYCGIWVLLFLMARQKKRPELLNQMEDLNNRDFES